MTESQFEKKPWFEKYGASLKLFLPFRLGKEKNEDELPDEKLGCISYFSLHWMNSQMWKASKALLDSQHIKIVKKRNGVKVNTNKLEYMWDKEIQNGPINDSFLFRTICKCHIPRFIFASIFITCMAISNYVGPTFVLKKMLECLEDLNLPKYQGIIWAAVFSATQLIRHIMFNAYWVTSAYAGIKVSAALQGKIYTKVISSKSVVDIDSAEIVNFFTSDMERVFQMLQSMLLLVPPSLITITHIVYCYYLLGPWSLLGNVVMLIYAPFMYCITKCATKYRVLAAVKADQRIGMMNQLLHNIKFIKIMAWENIFCTSVKNVRNSETQSLRTSILLQSYSWSTVVIAGNLALTSATIGYLMTGGSLETIQVLNLMSAFAALSTPLGTVVVAIKAVSEGLVSFRRIQQFLLSQDYKEAESNIGRDCEQAVKINDLYVGWLKFTDPAASKSFYLKSQYNLNIGLGQINLNARKGQLIGICGQVGSGKTTLLSTICGSTTIFKGKINISGKVALVTQQAWIFNGSVKQNILFGQPFDSKWYQDVISACSLERDLQLMAEGDETEIGERGSNLSGGQKQRINLARALYSNRDVYLLDDPLSAIDAKVAQHIFQEYIRCQLRDKTVLLVTHFPHYLQMCDHIVVLHQGTITEQGTHNQLMYNDSRYTQMVNQNLNEKQNKTGNSKDDEVLKKDDSPYIDENANYNGKIIKAEMNPKKAISFRTLFDYFVQCGVCAMLALVLLTLLFGTATVFNNVWFKIWLISSTQYRESNSTSLFISMKDPNFYNDLTIYSVSMIALILFALIKGWIIRKAILDGNSKLHNQMLSKVVKSAMSFFDSTPSGRIVNRFSRDLDELDVHIPSLGEYVSQSLIIVIIQVIVVCTLYPWFIIALFFTIILFVAFDKLFTSAVQEWKMVDNLLKPPVINHFNTTVQGLEVIKCYDKKELFIQMFEDLVDTHHSAYLQYQLSTKWISFRVDIIGWLAITVLAMLITATKDNLSTINGGLSLVLVIQACITLSVAMRFKSELEAKLTSMERIRDYITKLVEEPQSTIKDANPKRNWPTEGKIEFSQVHMRYQKDSPWVLHNLNVIFESGKKVGIIGRTGSGKSSIFSALLRLTNIQEGKILIDGEDISTKYLEDLRTKVAVIPQDPVLLSGTVKWNLDPTDKHSDEDIWDILEKTFLKDKIEDQQFKLQTIINPESGMFSVGEKQLFSLARAILKNSKILLLDEATANVDLETDKLIQNSIRRLFENCTVLTIAHRLNTIIDYDMILIMEAGQIIEYDTPDNLLKTSSLFRSMVNAQV